MEKFISSWSLVAELKVFGLIHVDVQQQMQISGQLSCAQSLEDFRFCTDECDLTITWSLKMIFLTVVACEIGRNSYFAGTDQRTGSGVWWELWVICCTNSDPLEIWEKVKNSSPKSLSANCRPAVYQQLTDSWPTANRHLKIWQVWWHRRHSTLIVLLESVTWCTTNWAKVASSYVLGKFIYEIAL